MRIDRVVLRHSPLIWCEERGSDLCTRKSEQALRPKDWWLSSNVI